MTNNPTTVYDAVGGQPVFERIIENFYAGIDGDPMIRPMYPQDLTESKKYMTLFVMQYFGGPKTYSEERGHPRLRMRHQPFSIGQAERDAWMGRMKAAIEAENFPPPVTAFFLEYFESTASFMMNQK